MEFTEAHHFYFMWLALVCAFSSRLRLPVNQNFRGLLRCVRQGRFFFQYFRLEILLLFYAVGKVFSLISLLLLPIAVKFVHFQASDYSLMRLLFK